MKIIKKLIPWGRKKKTLVVMDTSALMYLPEVLKAKACLFFVPVTAVRQLDGLKNDPERSEASRRASRLIEEGIHEGQVFILDQAAKVDGLANASDNKIIGTAVTLATDNPGRRVVLLTTDRNMRIVARANGINGVDFRDMTKEFDSMWKLPWKLHLLMVTWIAVLSLIPVAWVRKGDVLSLFMVGVFLFLWWFIAVGEHRAKCWRPEYTGGPGSETAASEWFHSERLHDDTDDLVSISLQTGGSGVPFDIGEA
ncbi:MAG: PIN domain-containing protein [Syntrophorhabdaceae bacterium]